MVALTGELLLMNLLQHNKKQEFCLSKLPLYQLSNSDFNNYYIIIITLQKGPQSCLLCIMFLPVSNSSWVGMSQLMDWFQCVECDGS